ncbi:MULTISPECIES: hypothetical protein [Niastella]|uniref:Uncharacterized protein n=1 Tax=Niastella soli TaxID=2821487 RepID=A0ABS3Z1B6_9BACT|nr:hypothetical protein [Niastella soli]MBO9203945.1 hypothetical protein [Niastella soli]
MKVFVLQAGLLALLSACHTNDHPAAFQEHVNSLQLNFKKPYQPAGDWLTDSLRSVRAKQSYAAVERKLRESDD